MAARTLLRKLQARGLIPFPPHRLMKLLDSLWRHTQRWAFVFPQERSLQRALALVRLLRQQLAKQPMPVATANAPPTYQTMIVAAAA